MPIQFTKVILFWISLFPVYGFASIIAPSPACDTIITTAGQVLLVRLAEGTNDSIVRFTYCGESGQKITEERRSNIREIRKAFVVEQQLPEGSEPVAIQNLPEGSQPVQMHTQESPAQEKQKITLWSKMAAIGGFGSYFMLLFAWAFNPIFLILVLPLSIIGLVFSIKVLKRTKKRPEFKKHRRMSKWSLAMALMWLVFIILYIIVLFFVLFLFFI